MLCRLFLQEIRHRWLTFSLSVLALAVAAGTLVAGRVVLASHDARTEELLEAVAEQQKETLATMREEMRKDMLKLTFNCVVLPTGQDVAEWHSQGYGSKTMPESYVMDLAKSKIVTVRHLLPSLQRRIFWPEAKRHILLVGSRGEAPDLHKRPKVPMVQPVPEGGIVLGHGLHTALHLQVGDRVKLEGREFVVSRCHEQRGSRDDFTAWIPLHDAQEILEQPGRINAILALECLCAGHDALPRVRKDITSILPDTQVFEVGSRVVARAEARFKLGAASKQTMEREKTAREELRTERKQRATLVLGVVMTAAALWLAILTAVNASQRRAENALLRTLGLSTPRLLFAILARAALTALLGGLIGLAAGGPAGQWLARLLDEAAPTVAALSLRTAGTALGSALALALLAAWLPALAAALRDPADELREQ